MPSETGIGNTGIRIVLKHKEIEREQELNLPLLDGGLKFALGDTDTGNGAIAKLREAEAGGACPGNGIFSRLLAWARQVWKATGAVAAARDELLEVLDLDSQWCGGCAYVPSLGRGDFEHMGSRGLGTLLRRAPTGPVRCGVFSQRRHRRRRGAAVRS